MPTSCVFLRVKEMGFGDVSVWRASGNVRTELGGNIRTESARLELSAGQIRIECAEHCNRSMLPDHRWLCSDGLHRRTDDRTP